MTKTQLPKTKEVPLVMLITGLMLGATSCDYNDLNEQEQRHAAFMPSKPSIEQQAAYREDQREQLRLNALIASK